MSESTLLQDLEDMAFIANEVPRHNVGLYMLNGSLFSEAAKEIRRLTVALSVAVDMIDTGSPEAARAVAVKALQSYDSEEPTFGGASGA